MNDDITAELNVNKVDGNGHKNISRIVKVYSYTKETNFEKFAALVIKEERVFLIPGGIQPDGKHYLFTDIIAEFHQDNINKYFGDITYNNLDELFDKILEKPEILIELTNNYLYEEEMIQAELAEEAYYDELYWDEVERQCRANDEIYAGHR